MGVPTQSTTGPLYMASVVIVWLQLATKGYHKVWLQRLLAKLALGYQTRTVGRVFPSGMCAFMRWGPDNAAHTPPEVLRCLLEGIVVARMTDDSSHPALHRICAVCVFHTAPLPPPQKKNKSKDVCDCHTRMARMTPYRTRHAGRKLGRMRCKLDQRPHTIETNVCKV